MDIYFAMWVVPAVIVPVRITSCSASETKQRCEFHRPRIKCILIQSLLVAVVVVVVVVAVVVVVVVLACSVVYVHSHFSCT